MHDGPLWARNHKPPGSVCPAHLSGSYTLVSYFSPLRPGSGNQVSSSTTCSQIHPSLLIPRPRPRPIRRPRPRPRPQSHLHRIVLALAHTTLALALALALSRCIALCTDCTALHLECLRSCLLVGCSWPLPPWIRSSPPSPIPRYIFGLSRRTPPACVRDTTSAHRSKHQGLPLWSSGIRTSGIRSHLPPRHPFLTRYPRPLRRHNKTADDICYYSYRGRPHPQMLLRSLPIIIITYFVSRAPGFNLLT